MHFLQIADSDKLVAFYNLEVILSVGYRVKSHRGTQFRIGAAVTLREYFVRGFVLTYARLEESERYYFDELVERVSRIRTSEHEFYRKVLDIFSISMDYDTRTAQAQDFLLQYKRSSIMLFTAAQPPN
jgi:hypothetical protein